MRILSFDGATAAALQVRLLLYFEEQCPGLLRSIDCFAGTSDGAIVAVYLASHVTDDDNENLRVLKRAIEFSNGTIPLFRVRPCRVALFAGGFWPLLDGNQFRDYFTAEWGSKTMADLHRKIVILSFDAFSWLPHLSTNLPEDTSRRSLDLPATPGKCSTLVDIVMASSGLPMALPLGQLREPAGVCVDGGVAANNPTMAAVVRAASSAAAPGAPVREALSTMRVLSLGASESVRGHRTIAAGIGSLKSIFESNLNWGWVQWLLMRPLLLGELILQSQMDLAHYECRHLLDDEHYRRIRPPTDEIMDVLKLMFCSASKLEEALDAQAGRLILDPIWSKKNVDWIRTYFLGESAAQAPVS